MDGEPKTRVLVVDDSEMDRMILKNILANDYSIIEANNGYSALELLKNPAAHVEGMLLDISMPVLDGFGVLGLMDRRMLKSMPILLISAEASKDNILRAAQFGLNGFIKKPFDSTMVLSKMKTMFSGYNVQSVAQNTGMHVITEAELKATTQYAEKLRRVYLTYLKSIKGNDSLYRHVSEIVHIMLANYYALKNPRDLSPEAIEIISQASYFYDIGRIVVRQENKFKKYILGDLNDIPETHTIAGSDLIGINSSPQVQYFVKIAADMCMHHHERYDGRGFPHGIKSSINNVYTQMCSIAMEFSNHFFTDENPGYREFNAAITAIMEDRDAFRPDVLEILQSSQEDIVGYYAKNRI